MLSTRHARAWWAARQNFLLQALESRYQTSVSSYAPSSSSSFSSTSIARDDPQPSTSTPIQAPPLRIAIPTPKYASVAEPAWLRNPYPTTLPATSPIYNDLIFRYRGSGKRSSDRAFARITFQGDHQAGLIANETAAYFLHTWDRSQRFKLGPLRSHLITNNHMACLAAQYGISERTFTSNQSSLEPVQQGRLYGKWLADSLEAHLGCLYEEKGTDAVRAFLAPVFYLELASKIGPHLPDFDFESVQKFKEQHAALPERKVFWASLKPSGLISNHIRYQALKQERQAAALAKKKALREAGRKYKQEMALKASQTQAAEGTDLQGPGSVDNKPIIDEAQAIAASTSNFDKAPAATMSTKDTPAVVPDTPSQGLGVDDIAKMLREAQEALQAHERNHFALHKQIHNLQRQYSIQKRSASTSTTRA